MYITCEQCSTIFRLDENLLNPNGSKVRCSQCLNVFVALPPETPETQMDALETSEAPSDTFKDKFGQEPDQYQDTFDKELEGIDLAELDSIMEEGRGTSTELDTDTGTDRVDLGETDEIDVLADFDEADLDMDFESALEQEGDALPVEENVSKPHGQAAAEPMDEMGTDLDLDMDFELDDWDDELVQQPASSDIDDLDVALDMDFELDADVEDTVAVEPEELDDLPEDTEPAEEIMLDENVELALDDFEDVLGDAAGKDMDDLPSLDISEEELELDLGSDESVLQDMDGQHFASGIEAVSDPIADEVEGGDLGGLDDLLEDATDVADILTESAPAAGAEITEDAGLGAVDAESDDLDLTGLDAFLDEDDDDSANLGAGDDDDELSLDNDIDLASEDAGSESDLMSSIDSGDDDLDLADLDALLDGDGDQAEAVASDDVGGDALSLGGDMELSLDDESTVAIDAGDADILLSAEGESDDLELGDLDALLDGDDDQSDGAFSDGEELSLDDDMELSLDEELTPQAAEEESETIVADDEADDFDIADLDGLLDGDGDRADNEESSLDEEVALSLDNDIKADAGGEFDTVLSTDDEADDFDLADLDDLLDDDDDQADAVQPDNEELSLDDDFELSLDDEDTIAVEGADAPAISADSAADDIDLGDLDGLLGSDDEQADAALSFDEEPVLGSSDEGKLADAAGDDDRGEFDLSDLEGLLDDDATPPASENGDALVDASLQDSEGDDLEFAMDEDLELSLDDEPSSDLETDGSTQLVSQAEDSEDFDLSELEQTILDTDGGESSEDLGEDTDLSLDDELLSLEDELDDAGIQADDGLGELEDLEFELDAEIEDKPDSQNADQSIEETILDDDQHDEALDLTDIEKMLEDDSIVPDKADAAGVGGAEKWADEAGDDLGMDDDEIDLSEIEEAIDSVDGEQDDLFVDEAIEPELKLDLEPEETQISDELEDLELELEDASTSEPEGGGEDSLDLTEFDPSEEDDKPLVETEIVDAGDIQLEFQIEESQGLETMDASAASQTNVSATSGFMEEEVDFSGEETIAAEAPPQQPEIGLAPAPKAERGKKPLLLIIPVLMLAMVAGYFGYNYTAKNNIRIPFISDLLSPKPNDPRGVLELATMEINSKFIENETAGRLFVITGKVRNGYSIPRKLIRLKGKLYTKGKVLVKTEQTFAGLVMADQELSTSAIADIKKRLNATADQDNAVTVEAGRSAPFMVVFSDLPSDLDEFVIELVSSIKAQ